MSGRQLHLIQTMQVYFAVKDEMRRLNDILEQAPFAFEIIRFAECRKQMDCLMIEAEKIVEGLNTAPEELEHINSEAT